MRVLVVFDKFKDCMSSLQAQHVAIQTLRKARPTWEVQGMVLCDGGEGFAHTLTSAVQGELRQCYVRSARAENIQAFYGLVKVEKLDGSVKGELNLHGKSCLGVVEMAQASGLQSLAPTERNVWETNSFGTGQLLMEAAHAGADVLLLGIGGSATHDLGLGALQALGLELMDMDGKPLLNASPLYWSKLCTLDSQKMRRLPPLWIASDVQNPLLGDQGAAYTYAKQKGASLEDLPRLEHATEAVSRLMCTHFSKNMAMRDRPGMGAAGGIGFGLTLAQDARVVSGATLVTGWLGLEKALANVDLVITGEGRLDGSSLQGKGPGAVLNLAQRLGKQLWVVAGAVDNDAKQKLIQAFPEAHVLEMTPSDWPLEKALAQGPELLDQALMRILTQAE